MGVNGIIWRITESKVGKFRNERDYNYLVKATKFAADLNESERSLHDATN